MHWRILFFSCLWGISIHAHDNSFQYTRANNDADTLSQIIEAAGPYGAAVTVAHGLYSFIKNGFNTSGNSNLEAEPPPDQKMQNLLREGITSSADNPKFPKHCNYLRQHNWDSLAELVQRGYVDPDYILNLLGYYSDQDLDKFHFDVFSAVQHLRSSRKEQERVAQLGNIGRYHNTKVDGNRWWKKHKVPALQHFAEAVLYKVELERRGRVEQAKQRQVILQNLAPRLKQNDRLTKRIEAIKQTVESPREELTKYFNVAKHPLSPRLEFARGNSVQLNIHQELVDVFNGSRNLSETHTKIIDGAVDIALDCKNQERYERAYNFSDFCWNVLETTKETIEVVSKGLGRGASQFSDMCKSFLDCFMYDPLHTTQQMVRGMLKRFYEIDEQHQKLNEPSYLATQQERDNYARDCSRMSQEHFSQEMHNVKAHLLKMFTRFRDDPKEATIESIAWTTEMVLSFGLWDIGVMKTRNLVGPLVNGIKLEAGYRTGKINVANESTNMIVHALETIPHEANQKRILQDAIDVVKKNGRLLETGEPLSKSVKQVTKLPYELIDDASLIKKYMKPARDLQTGKANFTLSQVASLEECQIIGEGWIGKNYKPTSDGSGIISTTKTPDYIKKRVYRYPTKKARGVHKGKLVANFEEYLQAYEGAPGRKIKNGHLIIKG
jgi:hypothetical protein